MTTEILKVRAKRLRQAIANMLDVSISTAQSLELVAKEDNFPSWDAAAACYGRVTQAQRQDEPLPPISASISIKHVGGSGVLSADQIFLSEFAALAAIRQRLNPQNSAGELLFCSGRVASGKTSTLHALVEDMHQRQGGDELELLQVGVPERAYSSGVKATVDDANAVIEKLARGLLRLDSNKGFVVVVGEIRDTYSAYLSVVLAHIGFKVLSTIHSDSVVTVVDRVRLTLEETRYHDKFATEILNGLVEAGRCTIVHHELAKYADRSDEPQSH